MYLTSRGLTSQATAVPQFVLEKVRFEWITDKDTNDCGVFIMKHMELFQGETFKCPFLMQVPFFFS